VNIICDIDGTLADITHRLHFINPQVGDKWREWAIVEVFLKNQEVRLNYGSGTKVRTYQDIGFTPDWPSFFQHVCDDTPIPHNVDIIRTLQMTNDVKFFTGRPGTQDVVADTEYWLDNLLLIRHDTTIHYRPDGDHRPDHKVKREMLASIHPWTPDLAIDDRQQVVDMWRANGIPCWQVAPGDF